MSNMVGVLGAGQMGNGIAHVFAQREYEVRLYDVFPAQIEKALKTIEKNLGRQAEKGLIPAESVPAILGRITVVKDLSGFADCGLVIEAATENETLKLDLFRKLDEAVNPGAILATNTSSIPITKIAAATKRPDKVIGMHFMNPVPVMQLVEVIRGLATSDATFQTVAGLVEKLGKTMAVSQDYPGFIVNRVLMPMINEAIFVLYEGIATAEDIDKGMKLGTNHPMGPLALADLIGLDTVLAILTVMYDGFKDPKFRPCPLLVKMVNAGYLGKKSGRGFYQY
ncbi:MAG: 3-hydroxybutyryl-CoA dehydrogenase [Anaerolineaceae bacterium]|nr:MAG: 3-hydroxybutyryl-CoA dehydrogenase [Anaerolineaceae bacterium]